jgi:hypothetical protein
VIFYHQQRTQLYTLSVAIFIHSSKLEDMTSIFIAGGSIADNLLAFFWTAKAETILGLSPEGFLDDKSPYKFDLRRRAFSALSSLGGIDGILGFCDGPRALRWIVGVVFGDDMDAVVMTISTTSRELCYNLCVCGVCLWLFQNEGSIETRGFIDQALE